MEAPAPIQAERSTPVRAGAGERAVAGLIAGGCLSVLAIAAWLRPAEAGHGTHTQIGLPPCSWAIWFDRPCPTCGMTTAFAAAGEGRWFESLVVQPAGASMAVGVAVAFWLALHAAATGSRIGGSVRWLVRPRIITLLAAGLIAAWVYKMMTWNAG